MPHAPRDRNKNSHLMDETLSIANSFTEVLERSRPPRVPKKDEIQPQKTKRAAHKEQLVRVIKCYSQML
jgi:hypothetical protein